MSFDHVVHVRARYSETDQMGVIYHANYIPYFEIGRTELMRSSGIRYADVERAGFYLTVVDVAARYRASAHYDDLLAIRTQLADASGVRVRFEYRILRVEEPTEGETLLCEGHTTLACIDRQGKPRRLPEAQRALFTKLLGKSERAGYGFLR